MPKTEVISTVNASIDSLSTDERRLAEAIFSRGPVAALDNDGTQIPLAAVQAFLLRPAVRSYLALLAGEFDVHEALGYRARFSTLRQLSRLSAKATRVLDEAMDGAKWVVDQTTHGIMMDVHGHLVIDRPQIDPIQLKAAEIVLDNLRVGETAIVDRTADSRVADLLQPRSITALTQLPEPPVGLTDEQRARSRERMRRAVDALIKKLPEIVQRAQKKLADEVPRRTRKPIVRKATRRKGTPILVHGDEG